MWSDKCAFMCVNEFVPVYVWCQMRQSAGIMEVLRHHMVSVSLIDLSALQQRSLSFLY